MTALTDPKQFTSNEQGALSRTGHLRRPNVVEHHWGYAISPNEHVIDLAVFLRSAAGLLMVSCFIAALGIWLVPAAAFIGEVLIVKAMASILLTCSGALLMSFVARGTRVRVQVNTANGEILEVVDGLFGKEVVLACHGMDAVERVDVVESSMDPAFGQIQVVIKDVGPIASGDGAVLVLNGLRDRLALDCGLDQGASARRAIWCGPLAA